VTFTCADVYACLEGDYSDWSIYDSFEDAAIWASAWYQYAIVNGDETVILLIDREYLGAKKYVIATKTLGTLMDEYVFPGVFAGADVAEGTVISVLGTYVVALVRVPGITKGNGIVIWKNGDLIKTLTAADMGFATNKVYSVSTSRSGKYIIVSGEFTPSGNTGWVLLEGS